MNAALPFVPASAIAADGIFISKWDPRYRRIERIAKRVSDIASSYCHEQLHIAEETAIKNCNGEMDMTGEIEKWKDICKRIDGHWRTLLIDSDIPNAFVTPTCPRKIFFCRGLIDKIDATDDELTMIICHELSHVILGHLDANLNAPLIITIIELLFMSFVDPIGLSAALFDYLVEKSSNTVLASYSRVNEEDADNLALRLMSFMCIDLACASSLMAKLHEVDGKSKTGWTDSHPCGSDRLKNVEEQKSKLLEELKDHPRIKHCQGTKQSLYKTGLLWYFGIH